MSSNVYTLYVYSRSFYPMPLASCYMCLLQRNNPVKAWHETAMFSTLLVSLTFFVTLETSGLTELNMFSSIFLHHMLHFLIKVCHHRVNDQNQWLFSHHPVCKWKLSPSLQPRFQKSIIIIIIFTHWFNSISYLNKVQFFTQGKLKS